MPKSCGVVIVNSPIHSDQGCIFLAQGVHTAYFSQEDILSRKSG